MPLPTPRPFYESAVADKVLRCYGADRRRRGILRPLKHEGSCPAMSSRSDQSKKSSTAFDQASTLVAVVELSRDSWLVAGVVRISPAPRNASTVRTGRPKASDNDQIE